MATVQSSSCTPSASQALRAPSRATSRARRLSSQNQPARTNSASVVSSIIGKSGMSVRRIGIARGNGLDADNSCQFPGGNLPVAVHQHDEGIPVFVFHDQRLHYGVLGHTEFAGGYGGTALFLVLIKVIGEFDLVGTQIAYRGRYRRLFPAHHAGSAVSIR